MWSRAILSPIRRLQSTITLLTLVGHLMVAVGMPVFLSAGNKLNEGSPQFPCQFRSCACFSAEECWKGDCCCFTLEEKWTWANEHGIEPPPHVRPLIESRKNKSSSIPKTASCCPLQNATSTQPKPCCSEPANHQVANSIAKSTESVAVKASSVRWVIGIFAQNCHGKGPLGLYFAKPATVSECRIQLDKPSVVGFAPVLPLEILVKLVYSPPTPPPKQVA